MNKTILQVPLSQQMKIDAENAALAQGFSSLQEAVRVFLNKLAQGTIQVTFEETIRLSDDAINRYNKTLVDIEQEKNIHEAENVNDLMKKLHNAN
jgi:antitoxin component of RelBE/YafQ-DinJ toxin-antitoxin module